MVFPFLPQSVLLLFPWGLGTNHGYFQDIILNGSMIGILGATLKTAWGGVKWHLKNLVM